MVGEKDMLEAPNGVPGLESFMPLLLNGVNEGWLSLQRLVEVSSENPAWIFGLYPRKGVVQPGSDADLMVVDMKEEMKLSNDDQITACGWTPYDGKKVRGVHKMVILRGNIIMEDGRLVCEKGLGEYIPRQ
jgi:dihydroorotase-like cyclic amidohydrolase